MGTVTFPTLAEDFLSLLLFYCFYCSLDFLTTVFEDYRGPGKMVLIKILHSKRMGNYSGLQAQSKNLQGLVFIHNREKLLLWDLSSEADMRDIKHCVVLNRFLCLSLNENLLLLNFLLHFFDFITSIWKL